MDLVSNGMRKAIVLFVLLSLHCITNNLLAQDGYGFEQVKGKVTRIGLIDIETDETEAYANAILWVVNNSDTMERLFVSKDPRGKQFTARVRMKNSQDDTRLLNCVLRITIGDGQLAFRLTEISVQNTKIPLPVSLEMYYPAKNAKQEEVLGFAQSTIEENLSDFEQFILTNNVSITENWNKLQDNKVVKGMSSDECLIIMGKPTMVHQNGEKTQWMYEDGSNVIFEDNLVKAIL